VLREGRAAIADVHALAVHSHGADHLQVSDGRRRRRDRQMLVT